jgi:enoyl-CoA hydratase/carnithine racemase
MSDKCLAYERRGAIAIVTIDDAPHNRMSLAFMDALESLVATIASDAAIRAVVITAAGDRNFSVGMDLKELAGALSDPGRIDVILDQRLRVLAVSAHASQHPATSQSSLNISQGPKTYAP